MSHALPAQSAVLVPTRPAEIYRGAVDTAGRTRLAEVLRERLDSCAAHVVLDLSAVTFFNSDAVRTLLDAAHHARIRAKPFTVISGPAVDRITGLLGVDARICWASTRTDAVPTPAPGGPAGSRRGAVTGQLGV